MMTKHDLHVPGCLSSTSQLSILLFCSFFKLRKSQDDAVCREILRLVSAGARKHVSSPEALF